MSPKRTVSAEQVRLREVLMLEVDRLITVDKPCEAATLILEAARCGFKPVQAQVARWYACGRGVERSGCRALLARMRRINPSPTVLFRHPNGPC